MRKLVVGLLMLVALVATGATAAPARSVLVTGALTAGGAAGSYVTVNCTPRGSVLNGSGVLYGVNPQTGNRYSYQIAITGSRTTTSKLVLTGKLANAYPLTITATTPSGSLNVTYTLPNRTVVVSTGQGTVTVR